jgi:hypothetical protein
LAAIIDFTGAPVKNPHLAGINRIMFYHADPMAVRVKLANFPIQEFALEIPQTAHPSPPGKKA